MHDQVILLANPQARRAAYPARLHGIMNAAMARASRQLLAGWDMLAPGPTPVWTLPALARASGVRAIHVKDESARSPLASFKVLGAPVALVRLVRRLRPGTHDADLLAGAHAARLRDLVVVSATDGNHGRALAAAARSIGCACVIVLHAKVSPEREAAIAALGARIVRSAGNYDDCVQSAARLARENGWHVVSDTSYDGYEDIPRDVMQGYAVIADELLEAGAPSAPCDYTHVFLQGGVGGLAAGIVSYCWERYGGARPTFVVVEPKQADCLQQSAKAGRAARASGSVDSVMAGLACGEASPLAWCFLQESVDFFLTVADEQAVDAMKLLARGAGGDVPVLAGESGAAGLAGLRAIAGDADLARRAGLDAASKVLLVNTEGATAPQLYESLTGLAPAAVLAAQRAWDSGGGAAATAHPPALTRG